jgi:hypothetical protein
MSAWLTMPKRMRLAVALGGIVGGLAHAQTAPDGQAGAVPGLARVVVVGNSEVAMVGQNGYCGAMTDVQSGDLNGLQVHAEQRVWIRVLATRGFRDRCVGDFSFVPQGAQTYLVNALVQNGYCVINLYLHVPGRNPVHLSLTHEERRSCLMPWNHQDTTPGPEKSP